MKFIKTKINSAAIRSNQLKYLKNSSFYLCKLTFILINNLIGMVPYYFPATFKIFKNNIITVKGLYDIFVYFFIIPLILLICILIYGILGDEELFAMTNNDEEDEDIGFTSESSESSSDDSLAAESTKLSVATRFDSNYDEVMDSYQSLEHYSNNADNDPIFIRGNLEFAISSTEFLMSLISDGKLPDRGGTFERMETIRDRATELLNEFNSTNNSNNTTDPIASNNNDKNTEDPVNESTNNSNTNNTTNHSTSNNSNNS